VAIRGMGIPLPDETWTFTVQIAKNQPVIIKTHVRIILDHP
jgi:hypothetical protein